MSGELRGELPDDPERVRACPACNAIVLFAARACPACGHVDPLQPTPEAEPDVPCRACGALVGSKALFCPRCGREQQPEPEPAATLPLVRQSGGALDLLAIALSWLGPLTLLAAILLALR